MNQKLDEFQMVTLHQILYMWKQELRKAPCVHSFMIEQDGKAININFRDEDDYNCNDCNNEFCFKSLKWLEDGGEHDIPHEKFKEMEIGYA